MRGFDSGSVPLQGELQPARKRPPEGGPQRAGEGAAKGAPAAAHSTALTMSSTTFLASPKTIMVLSM